MITTQTNFQVWESALKNNIQIVYQEHYPNINAVEFQVSSNNKLQQNVTFL